MAAITKEELTCKLAAHVKWLNDEEGGERLDLTDADLTDADLTGADLTDADLTGADLTGADLTDADLTGADLTDADLTGAILRRADLTDADLTDAVLRRAILTRAILRGAILRLADLTGAVLRRAVLTDADLTGAVLRRADLTDADLTDAVLTDAVLVSDQIPVIKNIDAAILDAIGKDGNSLNMRDWHTCETTHCRAGWAITLAGPVGAFMESVLGPAVAGALIYAASDPARKIPDFYCGNETAMADMRERAAAQLAESAA